MFFLIFDSIQGANGISFSSWNRNFLTQKLCNFAKSPPSAPLYTLKKWTQITHMNQKKQDENNNDVSCFFALQKHDTRISTHKNDMKKNVVSDKKNV